MTKAPRGIRILRQERQGITSVYLFKINGTKYMVSVQHVLFSIRINKRNWEFFNEESALKFYNRTLGKVG